MKDSKGVPKWETAVLFFSFVLIWAWFLARQSALRNEESLHRAWTAALLLAVVALVVIFVRRTKRTLAALREVHPAQRGRSDHN
jgi:cytochrome bd-type quinol oxidase subunit 2